MSNRTVLEKLFVLLPKDDRTVFRDAMIRQNMARLYPVAIMTLVIELAMFARSLFLLSKNAESVRLYGYMALYLLMALMMCFSLILARQYKADPKTGARWAGALPPFGTFIALLWAATITLLDMLGVDSQGLTLIGMQYILMVIFVLPPLQSLVILASVQLLFIGNIYLFFGDPSAHSGLIINTLINAALAWLVSRVLYAETLDQFHTHNLVIEKNDQLRRLNERLAELSTTDPLTMLMNRRHFDQIAQQEWRRSCREGQRITVAIADVDDFKQYNDIYGHLDGDACLRRVADAMSGELRRATDSLARFGGEEFIMLIRSDSCEKDALLFERIRTAVSAMRIAHSGSRAADHVTISIGAYSAIPSIDGDFSEMIREADRALYEAKANNRNQLVFKEA